MEIQLINHASVLVSHGDVRLLTDPWYSGPAFHKGWRLLVDTPDEKIAYLLTRTTHIWISHEHPDHFSIGFFKRWGQMIRDRGIKLMFQRIGDQRVADFLRAQSFDLTEMTFAKTYGLGPDFSVTCLKDEFYDSLISIRAGGRHVLNLNDCAVADTARAKQIFDVTGPCDVLLTQFSYAAWKGGRDNRDWRVAAASEKLNNIRVQAAMFRPRQVIPFASFVAFANARNTYLNDAANTPDTLVDAFRGAGFDLRIMQPGDVTDGAPDPGASARAADFWRDLYARPLDDPMTYRTVPEDRIRAAFDGWRARVFARNSRTAMRLARRLSPIRVLQPVVIHNDDTGLSWHVDPPAGTLTQTTDAPDLTMHSESLHFLFANSFGFDTLGVNGTFEESRPGGFARAARSIAIENLNNLGLRFGPGLLLEPRIIGVFLDRLRKVTARMKGV